MPPESRLTPPKPTAADLAYAAGKIGLGLVPGASFTAELFGLISPPLERRREEWAKAVVDELHAIREEEPARFAKLLDSDEFASVCVHATQAATRAAEEDKRAALSAAVINSARGIDIAADLQVVFVRYLDELTPTHVAVLRVFAANESVVRKASGYPALLQLFRRESGSACSEEEFCLFCGDLNARVLVRLSQYLENFSDLAKQATIVLEKDDAETLARVTDLGRQFLAFIEPRRRST